jgi:hypothetical protein
LLGQSGDIFGIASSLFSGLALFAVATTLWFDLAERRSARKPLLVCTVEQANEVTLDEASISQPRTIRLRASLQVAAENDTALNVSVTSSLSAGALRLPLGSSAIQHPLIIGRSSEVEFVDRINQDNVEKLIRHIEREGFLTLNIDAACDSIEGVSWLTSVSYKLSFRNDDLDLLKKFTHDAAVASQAWEPEPAIALKYTVLEGSWRHTRS